MNDVLIDCLSLIFNFTIKFFNSTGSEVPYEDLILQYQFFNFHSNFVESDFDKYDFS